MIKYQVFFSLTTSATEISDNPSFLILGLFDSFMRDPACFTEVLVDSGIKILFFVSRVSFQDRDVSSLKSQIIRNSDN